MRPGTVLLFGTDQSMLVRRGTPPIIRAFEPDEYAELFTAEQRDNLDNEGRVFALDCEWVSATAICNKKLGLA
jgi:hypothetical protein